MENKINCLICGKKVTNNNSYIGSHTKRIHGISYIEYAKKYYKNINDNFKIETCGFCEKDAIPTIIINHITQEYEFKYDKGYLCETEGCRNNISLLILNEPYNKKTYEHIGCHVNFLTHLYKINLEEAKKKKTSETKIIQDKSKCNLNGYVLRYGEEIGKKKYEERCVKVGNGAKMNWYIEKYGEEEGLKKWKYKFRHNSSLSGYIEKYGEIEGTKKYKERCNKIGETNKLSWYIERFGEVEGNKRWDVYIYKTNNRNYECQSKASKKIIILLEQLNIKYEIEYSVRELGYHCDFYLPEYKTLIEFYGDYWHSNPIKYRKGYYHKYLKTTSDDIWEKDKKRINKIYEHFKKEMGIIIIWESSIINKDFLFKMILENGNNIIYI